MIRPPLPRVSEGQILDLNLANHIIKRTEYAADLLRQYKILQGQNTTIAQELYGRRIATSIGQEAISTNFRVVFGTQEIYDPFTDTYITLDGTISGDRYESIRGNVVAGYNDASYPDEGIIYNGTSFVRVNFGVDDPYTRFYGTDGKSVVGEYYYPEGIFGSVYGIQCNLNGQKIQDVIYPKVFPGRIYDSQILFLADVYENKIIGEVIVRSTTSQQFTNSFLFDGTSFFVFSGSPTPGPISPYFTPHKIYKDYIVGLYGEIYKISSGQIIRTITYNGLPVFISGLYENIVSGRLNSSPFTDFLYYIDKDEFEIVSYNGDIG